MKILAWIRNDPGRTNIIVAGLAIAVALWLVGSLPEAAPRESVDRIRIGVLPDQQAVALKARYAPLIEYLAERTRLPYDLVIAGDYKELVERFARGEMDLAYMGGLTFLKAQSRAGAIPLVVRDKDLELRSSFLVPANSRARSLTDLKGARLSFGDRFSTSGHLMPGYFMRRAGMIPEDWFSIIRYSGAHDQTAYDVRDRRVDVGVADASLVEEMFADGRLDRGTVRVLENTPPFSDHVWVVRADLPLALQRRIRNAFLALVPTDSAQAGILESLDAGAYLPALDTDFIQLGQIAEDMSLLDRTER
jgi:phosphonate transport system substrate-binding protein